MSIAQISENAFLIDFELYGIREIGAVYLVRASKSCLIDSGTHAGAKVIIRELDEIGAFPPDTLILTHSHFDHSQGIPVLCREAEKRGKKTTVMASEKGISSLRDQSWNKVLDDKRKFENITDVTPLADGQTVDLEGLTLKVFDFSGHCVDDMAVYDESNRTVFVGDSVGNRVKHMVTFPVFVPPFWDPDGFRSAVDRLKGLDYERICLSHFGCLEGREAQDFAEDTAKIYEASWDVFRRADQEGKLDDADYVKEALIREAGFVIPDLQISRPLMRMTLRLVNLFRSVVGRKPINVAEVQTDTVVGWLTKGYRTYQARV